MSPTRPKRPCSHPGCGNLVDDHTPCPTHGRRPWEKNRPNATDRGYGHRWRQLRKLILARDPLCVLCLAEGHGSPSTTVDHITPRHLGGDDSAENLRGLCDLCHRKKSAREGQAAR